MRYKMNIKKLSKKLPYPIKQKVKCIYGKIPLSIRYGKAFPDNYNFFQKSQWLSREKL